MSIRQTQALIALQQALTQAFKADPTLASLTRGRIHDGIPAAPVLPLLAFTGAGARDFSSGESFGARIDLTLEAQAGDDQRGRAIAVLDAALAVALAPLLSLESGVLVRLDHGETEVDRLKDGRWSARAQLTAIIDA